MAQFPLWQISKGHTFSNGSQHSGQLRNVPIHSWIDMPIEVQAACEGVLQSSSCTGQYLSHQDHQRLSEALHLIDLQNMTILNTCSGRLNHIRRIISDEPLRM